MYMTRSTNWSSCLGLKRESFRSVWRHLRTWSISYHLTPADTLSTACSNFARWSGVKFGFWTRQQKEYGRCEYLSEDRPRSAMRFPVADSERMKSFFRNSGVKLGFL